MFGPVLLTSAPRKRVSSEWENHHSLFGLFGFLSISDPEVAGAIDTLVQAALARPNICAAPEFDAMHGLPSTSKCVRLEPASLSVSKTSSESQPASGATAAASRLDAVGTMGTDFALLWKADQSVALNSVETPALASAAKLVSDVSIHGSSIRVTGSSNQTAAEDLRSDVSGSPAQGLERSDSRRGSPIRRFGKSRTGLERSDSRRGSVPTLRQVPHRT